MTKTKRFDISKIPFIPTFFTVSFILSVFLHNMGELSIEKLILPIFLSSFFSILITVLFIRLLKREKGEIFTSVFIFIFSAYGQFETWGKNLHISLFTKIFGVNHILMTLCLGILILSYFFIRRITKNLLSIYRFLKIVSIIIVIMPLLGIIKYQFTQRFHPFISSSMTLPKVNTKMAKLGYLPDIYYIVPDSYASSKNLSDYYSFDNSSFISFLKNKGFYIASDSTSNYPSTLQSFSSTFNMEYLDYLDKYKNSSDQSIGSHLIQSNNVLKLLKSLGYKYYQMGSWWWPTQFNSLANDNYTIQKKNRQGMDGFAYLLLDSSMLNPFLNKLLPEKIIGESNEDKRDIVLYQFSAIKEVARLEGPKFVFVHIIAPHSPYVFGKNCEFINSQQTRLFIEEVNYANQIGCINKKLEKTVDDILLNSPKLPIILLQADEGAKFISARIDPPDNWKNANFDILKMKFPILSAYFLPGVSKDKMYISITPVNSFRMIFNLYFSTDLPLIQDRNFIFLDSNHLYEFEEVTDIIKEIRKN